MTTYHRHLLLYKEAFEKADIDLQVAKSFLFELCNEKGIDLYRELDNDADIEIAGKFDAGIKRILAGEPLNYVLGYSFFWGYKLLVNNNVLIPRYETEELVGYTLSYVDEYFAGGKPKVVDVGTGSGAIAIALKKEEPRLDLLATDISKEALIVAKRNALDNDAEISFLRGNMLEPLIENGIKVDILISNPPYIPNAEVIDSHVKDYEPHQALFGGEDGLDYYRCILKDAHKVLNEKSMLGFEIAYDKKEALTKEASKYFPSDNITVLKDINGKDRMMFIMNGTSLKR